jgi:hypothetical protein
VLFHKDVRLFPTEAEKILRLCQDAKVQGFIEAWRFEDGEGPEGRRAIEIVYNANDGGQRTVRAEISRLCAVVLYTLTEEALPS